MGSAEGELNRRDERSLNFFLADLQHAFALKFRLLSIQFASEAFETGRKMTEMAIIRWSAVKRANRSND